MKTRIFNILILALLVACTPTIQTQYVTRPIDRPVRPALPKILAQELDCLTEPTYQKLYDRQRLLTDYAVTLETIIDSTKPVVKTDEPHLDQPK